MGKSKKDKGGLDVNTSIQIVVADDKYMPVKAHDTDAAYDVMACLENKSNTTKLIPGQRITLDLGFKLGLPDGYEALISPRSGLASKQGITILNSPGIIDAGYRGDVKVILKNTGDKPFFYNDGDRIAQMRIKQVLPTTLEAVDELDETERGEGGFGSTGTDNNSSTDGSDSVEGTDESGKDDSSDTGEE